MAGFLPLFLPVFFVLFIYLEFGKNEWKGLKFEVRWVASCYINFHIIDRLVLDCVMTFCLMICESYLPRQTLHYFVLFLFSFF